MGHHEMARSLAVSEVAAAMAEATADVGLVGLGESSENALELISQIVQEAACPVIAMRETQDAEFVHEARGILMKRDRIDDREAFELLRAHKLIDMAESG
jgi:DNA-binding NarL/FixJ family response regulator